MLLDCPTFVHQLMESTFYCLDVVAVTSRPQLRIPSIGRNFTTLCCKQYVRQIEFLKLFVYGRLIESTMHDTSNGHLCTKILMREGFYQSLLWLFEACRCSLIYLETQPTLAFQICSKISNQEIWLCIIKGGLILL